MKVLVIGGTRFFGKRLVQKLIQAEHEVSILSRGQTPDPFGSSVRRLIADRTQKDSMAKALGSEHFDVVIDQMCMTASDAQISIELFKDKTDFYIMTSTLSVYPLGGNQKETAVDPHSYIPTPATTHSEKYAEGKRAAEHTFATRAPFAWAFLRIPVILAEDDYTERLLNQVRRVQTGKPVYYPNLDAKISFLHADDAARALFWLFENRHQGIFNFATEDVITPRELMARIESATGQKAELLREPSEEAASPFGLKTDWFMNVEKAKALGFQARPLSDWLPALIQYFARKSDR